MKFLKQIGDGEVVIKDNEVVSGVKDARADKWIDEFTNQTKDPFLVRVDLKPLKIPLQMYKQLLTIYTSNTL